MNVAEYIAEFLADKGVTDVFGLPGGVILDLLYAFEANEKITPHLSYHEQCAAFAAGGYAQASPTVGVAYATRGPGIMNMVTSVADAYCDSLAMLVFTSHGSNNKHDKIRVMDNQEFDLTPIFSSITKCVVQINDVRDVKKEIIKAYEMATTGRKGPVVIDIHTRLFSMEMPLEKITIGGNVNENEDDNAVNEIAEKIRLSKRPVILAGEGVKQSNTIKKLICFAEKNRIPVVSSRYSEDMMPLSNMYFGYIGTHATRYSNFILSKSDLIIGLGNRMAFPVSSESFGKLIKGKEIIRVEIDENEFLREIPGTINYNMNLSMLLPRLCNADMRYSTSEEWLHVCNLLKNELWDCDVNSPVKIISNVLTNISGNSVITSDVGNNELWLSRAYLDAKVANKILFSKTFGALGCSLGKAIGAHFATKTPVICFVGDQGFQLNIQELQVIANEKLPICIVILNNLSSGMIRNGEKGRFGERYLHTTKTTGYHSVDAKKIADAYGIEYKSYDEIEDNKKKNLFQNITEPVIIEIFIPEDSYVDPSLKKGDPCQQLYPYIEEEKYIKLDEL